MRIAFVRTGEREDRIHVRRDDGSEAGWRWGAAGPPHDLIHWAVEDGLGLERGFWGLVARGADFGFVNASGHSGKRTPSAIEDTSELLLAEAIVNSIQTALPLEPRWGDAQCLAWAATWAEEAGLQLPGPLDVGRYGELRREVEDWVGRYRALKAGTALEVSYPSASRRSEAARSGG